MSSYSFNNPRETKYDSSDENEQQNKRKNHWFYKLCPHIIIISSLLDILNKPDNGFVIMVTLMWIWLGSSIQKNKIIIEGISAGIIIYLGIFSLYDIYQSVNILIQRDIYESYPIIKNIIHWFTGFL